MRRHFRWGALVAEASDWGYVEEEARPADAEGGGAEDLRAVMSAVRRHLLLIVLVTAAGGAAAALYTYRLPPVYSASARIQLAKEPPDPTTARYVTYWEGIQKEYLNTQIVVLESAPLAKQTLEDHPEIARELEADLVGEAGGDDLRVDWLAGAFSRSVSVSQVRDTYLVDVTYSSDDPDRCAPFANALAETYMDALGQQRGRKTRLVAEKIGEQAELLYDKLSRSEQELREFLASSAPFFERHEELLVQRITANQESLKAIQDERLRLDAELEAIERVIELGRPIESAPAIAEDEIVRSLRGALTEVELEIATDARHGDEWPAMKAARSRRDRLKLLLQDRIATVRAQLQAQRDRGVAEERGLLARARQLNEESRELSKRSHLYASLQAEVDSNRRLYEEFANRLKELTAWEDVVLSNVRVVEPARGARRVGPDHRRHIGMGLALGLAVAAGLVLLLERLADKLRTSREASRSLALPVLGVVPEVREVSGPQLDLYATTRPHSVYAEAFRRLRVQLEAAGAYPPDGPGVLICTSGVPREGKTLSAIGLAIATATAGKRTILVDGDMRGPRVHRTFDMPAGPGLAEVLSERALWGSCIRSTDVPDLAVMTAGRSRENPAELLARGTQFGDLVARLRGKFDRVIIDCPPIAAVTDGALMGPFADGALLVVSGKTSSRTASHLAKTELARVGRVPLGLLFNHQGAEERGYYYYYSTYFRQDEVPPPAPREAAPAAPAPRRPVEERSVDE